MGRVINPCDVSNWVGVVSRDELRRVVLDLIRSDEEFRLAIAGALGLETIRPWKYWV
ncbi:hypothetical protein [Vulcanisaeta sp. JCM 16159]|uniref:hypothetical protein n=1 Tax=Vulcanisaeta sp. JCM 16159 TaxID=1295371 RepID=UPI001FB27C6D|nr:hypothetical protein [Vulcanisaeta sp. JCM 16159]